MKKILIITLAFILFGCNNDNASIAFEDSYCLIEVDVNSKKEKYDRYFQYDSFIALETVDASLIQQIDKVEFYNDTIFILDSRQATLFLFDNTGKFISKISNVGRSGKEYLSLSDFVIDGPNRVYVYDGMQGEVILYDFQGSYIDRIRIEKGYAFTKLSDDNWLFYLGNGSAAEGEHLFYNILIYNKHFELIDKMLPFNEYMQGLRHTFGSVKSVISNHNDTIYLLPLLSNYIYSYSKINSCLQYSYHIVFLNRQNEVVNQKMNPNEIKENLKKMNEGIIPSRVNNFYKIGNNIFFSFLYENRRWLCFYNKSDRIATLCDFTFDENGLFFNPVNYFSNKKNDKIVSIIDGDKFLICKNLDTKNNPIIYEINESINNMDDANPILVFYTLK